jgi:hypothetical protein
MAVFGLLGGLFVAGYAFEDPGGWAAVGMTALWLLPLVALSVFALLRPEAAAPVFVWVTVAVGLFTPADSLFGLIPRDEWGPVAVVGVFALSVALAFLGLHRAGLAGLLMIVTGLVQLAAIVVGVVVHEPGDGPGPGAMLGGSSGVVVMPLLLVGALFLLSGLVDHEPLRPGPAPRVRPAH